MDVFIANSNPNRLVNRRPVVVGCRLRLTEAQRKHAQLIQQKWTVNGILIGNSWSEAKTRSKTAVVGENLVYLPLDSEGDDRVTYKCYLYYKFQSQVLLIRGSVRGTFSNPDQTTNEENTQPNINAKEVSLSVFPSRSSISLGLRKLTLFCLSRRNPTDLIVWSFNGERLENVSALKEGEHYVKERSIITGRLRLINIKHVHAGRWSCEVQVSGGLDPDETRNLRSATYQLNLQGI